MHHMVDVNLYLQRRLAAACANMQTVVHLMGTIVWIGACNDLSKDGREKFSRAQELAIDVCKELEESILDQEWRHKNKYGVPCHMYEITLADGTGRLVDVGYEEDWGNIQEATPDEVRDWEKSRVGWGNDADGHVEIVKVVDRETGDEIDPMKWAKEFVWPYADKYSQ